MAAEFQLTTLARNAACNAIVDTLDKDNGTSTATPTGTPEVQITSAKTPTASQILCNIALAGATAFGNAATGVAAMSATSPQDTSPANAGTAAYWRAMTQGATPATVGKGNVGVGASFSMNISNTSIATGDTVTLTAFTVTVPAGTLT